MSENVRKIDLVHFVLKFDALLSPQTLCNFVTTYRYLKWNDIQRITSALILFKDFTSTLHDHDVYEKETVITAFKE